MAMTRAKAKQQLAKRRKASKALEDVNALHEVCCQYATGIRFCPSSGKWLKMSQSLAIVLADYERMVEERREREGFSV